MCSKYSKEKELIYNNPEYGRIYQSVLATMRTYEINCTMAGHELLIKAICIAYITSIKKDGIVEILTDDEILQLLEKITIIPSIAPVIKDIHPAEQHMKEALRASGIDKDPFDFIRAAVPKN